VIAGFLQIVSPASVRLRVWERGAGETLACGTGACAAVVHGIRLGQLGPEVRVATRGGELSIRWPSPGAAVMMTGDAVRVFDGLIEL
jgi:diaminopimelate epimerase